ncbi:nucleoprotein TPR-like [Pectinophora gossypiella]|uniref:nucleoprotein TPR-like n=1 Tax=Pectinophora gossypiella TaxID=13191 RepID=UPI00214F4F5A|nr:nucleoprotein TPR-like [Pectinophora gossypiella]
MGTPSAVRLVAILVLCSAAQAIRVPIDWTGDSEVTKDAPILQETSAASQQIQQQPIPIEYFQYPAPKPQFAVDVATYHGVKNPESHYKAYPIRPHGQEKPVLGKHKLLDENNPLFEQFQRFTQINEGDKKYATPVSMDYEVFHPYKAEEPAFEQLYKDPVLGKIRNDIYNSQSRLKNYENEAGKPDIQDGEYLESPEQTDHKKHPQRNVPVPYEIHRPQRRPIYYRPSPNFSRDRYLNQKFRHPWNQHNAKIRPVHYRPLKNHIHRLRQNHAIKFDDEHNEYPQVPTHEQIAEVPEGYDIYQRGKEKYIALRNNVDESINNAVKENRPTVYQRLELQNNGGRTETQISDDDEPEFVPIKNYAQVRKTETMKHLPREAAFQEAASYDEIKNAPRLREAIKSTKAQTVYTEEGYEDAAYDHAGEEKHAAENEGHGGFLKEKEISRGKYKTPSLAAQYQDASGNEYKDQVLHGEKWNDDQKEKEEENDEINLAEDENHESIEDEEAAIERSKRENKPDNAASNENDGVENVSTEHEVNKRETAVKNFKVPEINLNSTFLTPEEILKMAKLKLQPKQQDFKEKYPYYFKNLKTIHKDSPLRYAENLKLIPKKSKGGTEFYDSRNLECPEVGEDVDALPEKLKKGGNPDSDESDESAEENDPSKTRDKADFEQLKKNRRLKGLGDKIDCFKSKFFGENPLDSPFFKEEIISNPEPIIAPTLPVYKFISKDPLTQASTLSNVFNASEKLKENTKSDLTALLDKLRSGQKDLQESLVKTNQDLKSSLIVPQNISLHNNTRLSQQTNVYSDVFKNIQKQPILSSSNQVAKHLIQPATINTKNSNVTYISYQNKEDVTIQPRTVRKKRAAPFVYEPYKIIRDGQVQESKKTTTTSNISPLIRQLQSSRIIDKVKKSADEIEQPVARHVSSRIYKDIGRKDRDKNSKPDESSEASFIDVNIDKRRGEPRYEVRIANHKSKYTPVDNKKAMSVKDYETQTNKTVKTPENKDTIQSDAPAAVRFETRSREKSRQRRPTTAKPYFDVSQFIPKASDLQRTSASNTVKKVVKQPATTSRNNQQEVQEPKDENDDEEEDYEEYDDEEIVTTTTTSTPKPSFRKRRPSTTTTPTTTTTTETPEDEVTEYPRLRLITRFRSTAAPVKTTNPPENYTENPSKRKYDEDIEVVSPKYREKKKKSSKSTLVTDTKSYGDDNDDMMRDAVDAMIGVKQNMDDYKPNYEKEIEEKSSIRKRPTSSSEEEEDDDEDDDDEIDSDEDDDEDFEDDDDEEESDEENESTTEPESEVTTPEPTKRTLVRTTEAPVPTTEARSAKLEQKPIIHKKKIEIHKEIPVNNSSPHITQFKQDIKEIEIIKEMPAKPQKTGHRKPQKNIEALELYKDENLPKEVNKLGAVEVFKENLDLRNGPRHGGNYRSAQLVELNEATTTLQPMHGGNLKALKDPETSQSKNTKQIELSEILPARRLHSGNLRSRNSNRNGKLELADSPKSSTRLHGGNLKSIQDKGRRRESSKSAKLIELDDDREDDDSDDMHGGNFKSYDNTRSRGKPLHGGNYRSAKLIKADDEDETTTVTTKGETSSNPRSKAAVVLNSFAQAVPILTTTPAYILDPSKRMYYYVDA